MKSKKRLSVLVILAVMVAMLALPMSAYAAVKINKTKATIDVGKTVTLKITGAKKGTKIKWTTNKKDVATVSSKGVVKGIKAGKAKVTAKVGKKNYNCTVTVKAKGSDSSLTTLKTVRIAPYYLEDDEMHIGETLALSAVSQDPVTWKSTNPAVATVDANGVVTAIKKGHTDIVARSTKDKTLYGATYIRVADGRELKKENYTNYLNFELKTVPVAVFDRGSYRNVDGQYVLGNWEEVWDSTTGEWKWVNKGDKRELYRFYVAYYLALDAASLNKNIDFDRTNFNVMTSCMVAPETIITANPSSWTTPSFAVTGTKHRRYSANSGDFAFTEFKNGVLTYESYDEEGYPSPIFEPSEGDTVYEFVYPDEFVQTPLYADRVSISYGGGTWRTAADKISREYLVRNLVDTATFSIFDFDGTLYTK